MTLTLEDFVSTLEGSGLLGPGQLDALIGELGGGRPVTDPIALAEALVAQGILTDWQADKLLSGVQKGFFLGKHKLLRHLAQGGMSSVYEAEHQLMHRRVALKVLPKSLAGESGYLERFYREARALARLDHPNIVRGFDVGQDGDHHYLVMEFIDGLNLEELVQARGPLPLEEAAEMIRQTALGLQHAHEAGFVHRDIKPSNLKLEAGGVVKILDLGLVRPRLLENDQEASLTRLHDEKVFGTIDYLSPEQAVDSHAVDIRSDVYSLGCTLYFLLSGSPPFPQGTLAERLLAHQMRLPARIVDLRPDAPESLDRIVSRMMEKRPEDRYATPREVASVLGNWLSRQGQTPVSSAIDASQSTPSGASPPRTRIAVQTPRDAGPAIRREWQVAAAPIDGASSVAVLPPPGPVESHLSESQMAHLLPEAGQLARPLIERWWRWSEIVGSIAANRRLSTSLDENSYQLLYEAIIRDCRTGRETADLPMQALLVQIEDLVAPWVTLNALRSFLADNASSRLVERLHEIDREMFPPSSLLGRLTAFCVVFGAALLAIPLIWLILSLVWPDHPGLSAISIWVHDAWSKGWSLIFVE